MIRYTMCHKGCGTRRGAHRTISQFEGFLPKNFRLAWQGGSPRTDQSELCCHLSTITTDNCILCVCNNYRLYMGTLRVVTAGKFELLSGSFIHSTASQ